MQIIKVDDRYYMVLKLINNEYAGSVAYDRTYRVIPCTNGNLGLMNTISFIDSEVRSMRIVDSLPETLSGVEYKFKSSVADDDDVIHHTYKLKGNTTFTEVGRIESEISLSSGRWVLEHGDEYIKQMDDLIELFLPNIKGQTDSQSVIGTKVRLKLEVEKTIY